MIRASRCAVKAGGLALAIDFSSVYGMNLTGVSLRGFRGQIGSLESMSQAFVFGTPGIGDCSFSSFN